MMKLTTEVSNRVPSIRERYRRGKVALYLLELAITVGLPYVYKYGQTIIFDSFMGENLNSMPVLYT